ncbi:MAG TPA: hypothetical protein P5268_04450 [Candidatus Marinimicrobia bacterium]|nr:hypothetical protein [Candidatus Neomarinimicrobiota bacterium]
MMSKMDEVLKKVLNNEDIFNSPYDKRSRSTIPVLFRGVEWNQELRSFFEKNDKGKYIELIDSRIQNIRQSEKNANQWRKEKIKYLETLADCLKNAFNDKRNLLQQLFNNLNWFGLVECKLPEMDDYGKVVERYDIVIVEQYFIDKINRISFPHNKALSNVLEYVKDLYNSNVSTEEIAYFVRKLNSLTTYWEVLK